MMDWETFTITIFVLVDDLRQALGLQRSHRPRPGPKPSLSVSEVLTLTMLAQHRRFFSDHDFYRFANKYLRDLFPNLPDRTTLNRLASRHLDDFIDIFVALARMYPAQYQVLDCSGVVTRHRNRRGCGWIPEATPKVGRSSRLGWFCGFQLMMSVTEKGMITGFGIGGASESEQKLAQTFFAARHYASKGLRCVGDKSKVTYLVDKGFEGEKRQMQWELEYDAQVLMEPLAKYQAPQWPKEDRKIFRGKRQIVETTFGKLHQWWRLASERPHKIKGLQIRLAAKAAIHNMCMHLNMMLGRKPLAFADLVI